MLRISSDVVIKNTITLLGQSLSSNIDSTTTLAYQLIDTATSLTFYGSIHWKILQCYSPEIIADNKDDTTKGKSPIPELYYVYNLKKYINSAKSNKDIYNIIGLSDKNIIFKIQGDYLYANASTIRLLYIRKVTEEDETGTYFNLEPWLQIILEYNLALLIAKNIGLDASYINNLQMQLERLTNGAYYQDKNQDNYFSSKNIFKINQEPPIVKSEITFI